MFKREIKLWCIFVFQNVTQKEEGRKRGEGRSTHHLFLLQRLHTVAPIHVLAKKATVGY